MIDTVSSSQINQEESVATFSSLPDKKFVTNKKLKIYKWIDEMLRIELTDGRVYEGILLCVDNQANIILGDAREYWIKQVDRENSLENLGFKTNQLEVDETLTKRKKQKKKTKKGVKQKDGEQSETDNTFKCRKELSPMRKIGMAMISQKYIKHIYLVKLPISADILD